VAAFLILSLSEKGEPEKILGVAEGRLVAEVKEAIEERFAPEISGRRIAAVRWDSRRVFRAVATPALTELDPSTLDPIP
jgi:hypothetical protein